MRTPQHKPAKPRFRLKPPLRSPDLAALHGLILQGLLSEAERHAQALLAGHGRLPELLQPMGEIQLGLGRYPQALEWLDAACAAQPHDLNAANQRALVLSRLGRHDDAHAAFMPVLRRAPNSPALLANIGANLSRAQRHRDAEGWLRQGLALDAQRFDLRTNLACTLIAQDRMAEARSLVDALLVDGCRSPEVLQAHASLLHAAGRHAEAHAVVQRLLAQDAHNAGLRLLFVRILGSLGRYDEQRRLLGELIAADPTLHGAQSALVFSLNYSMRAQAAELRAQALRYGALLQAQQGTRRQRPYCTWRLEPDTTRLRVGLVSGDFRNHPVGYFLEAVVPALRARGLEVIAYPTLPDEDDLTRRIRPHFAQWRPLVGLSDAQAAEQIHEDGVQVLVDLSGHTKGHRLPVFALKPAPVQATWLGYIGTTGVAAVDWLIADDLIAPAGTEAELVEKVWRMPGSYVHLSPPAWAIEPGPLPARVNGYITFGSFNNLAKMTDAVVALWARLLLAVPGSRLFLKCPQLKEDAALQHTRARYALQGIAPERLILEGPSPRAGLLAAYNRVDIALDPFPYTGGTTSLEALWMSVPVLTLRGGRLLSRMGVTLLVHAGLPDWVATDAGDFLRRAVAHSADLEHLAQVRAGLRPRVLASPLMDTPRFARDVEATFRGMWEHWLASEAARVP